MTLVIAFLAAFILTLLSWWSGANQWLLGSVFLLGWASAQIESGYYSAKRREEGKS